MTVFIDAIDGPLKGKSFVIQDGYTIGRTQGDILLEDSKISGAHAKAVLDPLGNLALIDLGSANGIRLGGQKVQKVTLKAGIQFQMGRCQYRVRLESISQPRFWKDVLAQKIKELQDTEGINRPQKLKAFKPALKLSFVQGIQADEEVILGYGPRTAGLDHPDVCLWEPGTSEICFHLQLNHENSIELCTQDAENLRVNGNQGSRYILKEGDLISLGNTQMRVSFVKEIS